MSSALSYFNNPDTEETQKLVMMMDRFFDCLNARNINEWAQKKKEDLKPYYSPDDKRFDVSIISSLVLIITCAFSG